MAPSVTGWAHTAFPEPGADRPYINLGVTAVLDPDRTAPHPVGADTIAILG
jgi:hypothetical protein